MKRTFSACLFGLLIPAFSHGQEPPDQLLAEEPGPSHNQLGTVTADARNYYYVVEGAITGVSRTGGAPFRLGSGIEARPLLTDGENLYWARAFHLVQAPTIRGDSNNVGGRTKPTINGETLAMDDEWLYFAAVDQQGLAQIDRVRKTGGDDVRIFQIPKGEASELALDHDHVYWTVPDGKSLSSLWRVGKDGQNPTTLARNLPGDLTGIWIDGDDLYFASSTRIGLLPTKGGAITWLLPAKEKRPLTSNLAISAGQVYFCRADEIDVVSRRGGDGHEHLLAHHGCASIADDGTYLLAAYGNKLVHIAKTSKEN